MREVESISHSGIEGPDTRAVLEFYERILGGTPLQVTSGAYEGNRGGNPHPCSIIGDYLFVIFPDRSGIPLPPTEQLRGGIESNARHAFAIGRERFDAFLDHLRQESIPFEGPVTHPEGGPLGQSVYFQDAGGNFFEVCWRRDENATYAAVPVTQG